MSDEQLPPSFPSAPVPPPPSDRQLPVDIEDEMRASYLDYAMSVIIGRALPDVRDGLKPVHRRVLFAMHELGNSYNRAYKKSARVVGDVIGKYHPHGDQAVYDSLVRMAQPFSLRNLLVDGQGNFGSVDGDRAAAMRYTEVRMARLAGELLGDIEKETVDFTPNYDESLREPSVLPAKFPNLLINGSSGIAVGMATNIPPHNLGEVLGAAIDLAENPSVTTDDLMRHVPGPDFPTGGIIYGTTGMRNAYETGRGVIYVRGKANIEEGKLKDRLVITEIPYQVNKTSLIEKIADMVRDKRIEGISDIRDESDRDGMRIVIEIKRDGNADVVLNQLYTNTALQTSFGINMLAIVGGQPRVLGLKALLEHFLAHRRDVVTRRSRYELREAQKRFNVVFGLLSAIDSIERIISLIRAAPDGQTAKKELMAEPLQLTPAFLTLCDELLTFPFAQAEQLGTGRRLHLGDAQAQAILDMRLSRLTGLERDKLAEEAKGLRDNIVRLNAILSDGTLLRGVIVGELRQLRENFADARRTQLVQDARTLSVEDLIADEPMVVTVSHMGYVKRNPVELYQAQNRGGRGKTAATTRDEDFVENMFVASSHAYVLIFTDRGKVYWLRVHEIPQAGRQSRGKPVVNLIRIEPGERIAAILPIRAFSEGAYVVMATVQGTIKKTDLMAFAHPRPSGLIALSIDPEDKLMHVGLTDGTRDILMATRQGLSVRFPETQVRPMGRTARGVRAISLKRDGDAVVGMVICDEATPEVFTVCDHGYGKRSAIDDYRRQTRGGSGIINIKVTERNGLVAGVCGVAPADELMLVTNRGMMIRFQVAQTSRLGRGAQGVRLMSLSSGEQVASIARIAEADAGDRVLDEAAQQAAASDATDALPDAPEDTAQFPKADPTDVTEVDASGAEDSLGGRDDDNV